MTRASLMIKAHADDWQVRELGWCTEPGPHALFYVEKVQLNTLDVVTSLAQHLNVPAIEIGYAGRKDKWGVTAQWFSAPRHCEWPEIPGTRCLQATTSQKKLRVGQLSGNEFLLTLREVQGLSIEQLANLGNGFPNKFGSQRTSADNRHQALAWLRNRPKRRSAKRGVSRRKEGWYLSVLRAALFNDVVEHRAGLEGLQTLVDGDFLQSGFATAPLWGRGRSKSQGRAREIEDEALLPSAEVCQGLEFAGVSQARRPVFVKPRDLHVQATGLNEFTLKFSLPPGSYATAMLASVADVVDGAPGVRADGASG